MQKDLAKKLKKDFMTMSKILLVYNEFTPSIIDIENSQFEAIHVKNLNHKNNKYDYAFDFTFLSLKEKMKLFEKLETVKYEYYSDLTCYSNQPLHEEYQKLMGSFSCLLVTETRKIEFFCQGNRHEVTRVLSDLGLSPFWYESFGIGFVYPRVLAQIVNEAYFALEDKIANKKDIDRAMKFGVNYPLGPFEWSQTKETIFKTLLKELQTIDPKRYQISQNLNEVI